MNHRFQLRHLLAATAALLASLTPAIADTVGGSVTAINTLTKTPNAAIVIGTTTAGQANGQTDTTIVNGTIDNNFDHGWKLTVVSANLGKLKLGGGGAGREILYTNVKLITTGGTLGSGLTSPVGTHNIVDGSGYGGVAGTTYFNTGTDATTPAAATTATVAYAYSLQISWASDLTLLAGSYTDTVTLTLANDS
jgi:hypothetical protein